MLTLADLSPGERAEIVGYAKCDRAYRNQLLAMGLTPSARFTVLRRAPLGDPILIQIHDSQLSLRINEASILQLKRVSDE